MVGGTQSVRVYSKWLGSAVLIALLLGSSSTPTRPTIAGIPHPGGGCGHLGVQLGQPLRQVAVLVRQFLKSL